jgi:hypothetical protein
VAYENDVLALVERSDREPDLESSSESAGAAFRRLRQVRRISHLCTETPSFYGTLVRFLYQERTIISIFALWGINTMK